MKNSTIKKIFTALIALVLVTFLVNSVFSQTRNLYDVENFSENQTVAVGSLGLVLYSTDAGFSWYEHNTGNGTDDIYAVEYTRYLNTDVFIAVGGSGMILKNEDMIPHLWKSVESGVTQKLSDIVMLPNHKLYVCGDEGVILTSDNIGETWVQVLPVVTTTNLTHIDFVDENYGYITDNEGNLITTEDGGATWRVISLGIGNVFVNAIDMRTRLDGTIVGENGLILTTRDGGQSWVGNAGQVFNDDILSVKYLSPKEAFASGKNGLIVRTTDYGSSWFGVISNTSKDVYALDFGTFAKGFAVGGYETISESKTGLEWYKIDFYANVNQDAGNGNSPMTPTLNNPVSYSLSQNYPNPFNPSTKINYSLPFDSKVTLTVFDAAGKTVSELVNNVQTAGVYTAEFNAGKFTSGVYFYRIQASSGNEQFSKTMKMILIK